jgi:hypothetical protein
MVDAGQALRDSGRDARDAADGMTPDADAQVDCATCTSAGAVRTITADADLDQLVTGSHSITYGDGARVELVRGPFVLTDVRYTSSAFGASTVTVPLWIAPTDGCGSGGISGIVAAMFGDTRAVATDTAGLVGQPIHGARIPIRAGEALCASENSGSIGTLRWSGFRPYE